MAEAAAKKREKQAKKEVNANRRAANRLLSAEEVAAAKAKLRKRSTGLMQLLPIVTAIGFGIAVFISAPGESTYALHARLFCHSSHGCVVVRNSERTAFVPRSSKVVGFDRSINSRIG